MYAWRCGLRLAAMAGGPQRVGRPAEAMCGSVIWAPLLTFDEGWVCLVCFVHFHCAEVSECSVSSPGMHLQSASLGHRASPFLHSFKRICLGVTQQHHIGQVRKRMHTLAACFAAQAETDLRRSRAGRIGNRNAHCQCSGTKHSH